MQAYTGFAMVYDIFMDNVPYDEWTEYLTMLLKEQGVLDGLVLELGCGTGNITRRLRDKGYDMIGIDNSYEMLEIARDREYDELYSDIEFDDDSDEYEMDDYEFGEEARLLSEDDIEGSNIDYKEDIDASNNESKEEVEEANSDYEADMNGVTLDYHLNIKSELSKNVSNIENIDYKEDGNQNSSSGIAIDSYELNENSNDDIDSMLFTNKKSSILYLEQDMREFELYGTVKAVVSICDSMNYITTKEDLLKVFKLVNNYLDKDGIFIFDMNTEYKYREILGDRTIAENRDDCSFIWENYYNSSEKMNEYQVTIYVKSDMNEYAGESVKTDYYERFEEIHHQKAYTIAEVKELLREASLDLVGVYDAFTKEAPSDRSERVYFVAKETYQDNKKYV